MDIRFVPFEEIDQNRWSGCVHYAANGRVFGYYWYLKNLVKEWDAFVEGDYQSVFPLIKRNGTGLYQPELAPQLGLFSVNLLSPKRIRAFTDHVLDKYSDIHIALSDQQAIVREYSSNYREKPVWKLSLDQSYMDISKRYDPSFKELLSSRSDVSSDWHFKTGIKPEQYIEFCKNSGRRFNTEHVLQRIMYNALHRGIGAVAGIFDRNKNPLGMIFWIYSHHKVELIDLYIPENDETKLVRARMLDMIIRTHNGNQLVLEFNELFTDLAPLTGATEFRLQELVRSSLKGRLLRALRG